jgi:LacI family transcriptional regulator
LPAKSITLLDSINLKKLASQLNLSVSTVSKAFRNGYDINAETRDRILALAKKLNYQPNPLASSLRTQKSRTIAVIIPEVANNFFALAINGIESIARTAGYHVLIYLTHEELAQEIGFTRHLQSGRVDGIIMSLSGGDDGYEHLEDLKKKGIPMVFFDRVYESTETTRVTTNDHESGYLATKHLVECGCKKPVHITMDKNISIAIKRKQGYMDAMKDLLPRISTTVIECGTDLKKNKEIIRNLLTGEKPDGVFSAFEKLAIQCYQCCEETGLRIPDDVKLISFSNLESASLLNPSLTTITQPAFAIGKKAAEILFHAMENKTTVVPNEHIILKSVLEARRSTERLV